MMGYLPHDLLMMRGVGWDGVSNASKDLSSYDWKRGAADDQSQENQQQPATHMIRCQEMHFPLAVFGLWKKWKGCLKKWPPVMMMILESVSVLSSKDLGSPMRRVQDSLVSGARFFALFEELSHALVLTLRLTLFIDRYHQLWRIVRYKLTWFNRACLIEAR